MKIEFNILPSSSDILAFVETFPLEKPGRNFIRLCIVGLKMCFPASFPVLSEYYCLQKEYIDSLFKLINFLYLKYEPGQTFFDLLEQAMAKLNALSVTTLQKKQLPEYFEKTAMIFQIAANETEIEEFRGLYVEKSKFYIQKANEIYKEYPSNKVPAIPANKF